MSTNPEVNEALDQYRATSNEDLQTLEKERYQEMMSLMLHWGLIRRVLSERNQVTHWMEK